MVKRKKKEKRKKRIPTDRPQNLNKIWLEGNTTLPREREMEYSKIVYGTIPDMLFITSFYYDISSKEHIAAWLTSLVSTYGSYLTFIHTSFYYDISSWDNKENIAADLPLYIRQLSDLHPYKFLLQHQLMIHQPRIPSQPEKEKRH